MTSEARSAAWLELECLPPGEFSMVPARDAEDLYRREVPRLARGLTRSLDTATSHDVVHDAFQRFLAVTASGWNPVRPGAYLAQIVRNLVRERHRRDQRRRAEHHEVFDELQVPGVDPLPQLEARDSLRRIDAALAAMRPLTRDVFLLHRIDGLDYGEIGERMGLSVKAVQKHMTRALRTLRTAVATDR